MKVLEVTPEQLEMAIRSFGTNSGGGFVDQHGSEYLIRNVGETLDLDQLKNIAVATHRGRAILLHELADVSFAPRTKRGEAGFNGAPAIIMSVQKMPAADTLPLTQTIEAELAALQKTLPQGVKATHIQFRQATFIETSIANVKTVLVEAAIVVAVVLILFLMNWRATVISLTAIPISILVTILIFSAVGLTINTMTLGGLAIAIGELVDDAVVDVENILRRLKNNTERAIPLPVLGIIAAASREVRSGIVYATFIIILVFVPLFALTGVEGRLFTPLGIAYIVSILASLVTAITVTPVLAYFLLRKTQTGTQKDSAMVRVLKAGNQRLLNWAFDHPRIVVMPIIAAVFLSAAGATLLPRAFLPPFNEGTLLVGMQYNPGISLAESHRLGFVAERLVLTVPEVVSVGRRTGRAELDSHAEGVQASELDIDLHRSQRPKEAVYDEIREKLSWAAESPYRAAFSFETRTRICGISVCFSTLRSTRPLTLFNRLSSWSASVLRADLAADHLGDERRHGVAEHALHVVAAAVNAQAIGESLQPAQLLRRQAPARPVERPGGGARLRLDRP